MSCCDPQRVWGLCVALVVALASAPASRAQSHYSVTGGGAQWEIGRRAPLPLQPPTTGGVPMSPIGTGTMFPALLVPVNPDPARALVKQTGGPDPKKMTVPPGVLARLSPKPTVLAGGGGKLWQIRTRLSFSAPAAALGAIAWQAGGRTGAATTSFGGVPAGATIRYTRTANQFGGPAQAQILAVAIRAWIGARLPPCKHPIFFGVDADCVAQLVDAHPGSLVAAGGPAGFLTATPGGPPSTAPFRVAASVPNPSGLVAMSATLATPNTLTNMATSAGFPWTTGRITLSQPSALGSPEVFTITGMDSRVGGVGTISFVSGALSVRTLWGPQANRGWLRLALPEPEAALGAVAAIVVLAGCHIVTRRGLRHRAHSD